jgi:SpoVK/Ycf46/Vps4 family AAA+-type ATPase
MGYFKVKSKEILADLPVGTRLDESDFACLTSDGSFVQLEYIDEEKESHPYIVKPGIWSLKKTLLGYKLETTSFVSDAILDTCINVKELTDKIDCFFRNLHVYKEYGIEIPRRAALLYGPPGGGKTTGLINVSNRYVKDGKTAVIIWPTDKFDAFEVKEFIKSFKYEGTERLIVVAEDIGGVEIDKTRIESRTSLLSLLDNKEKSFKIPVFIIATTNFPENFLGNLTNRPGRFDDKIEIKLPSADMREDFLKFFTKDKVSEEMLEKIRNKKYKEFSVAHLQEAVIRSAIYEQSLEQTLNDMVKEIEHYKNMFTEKSKLGITFEDDES